MQQPPPPPAPPPEARLKPRSTAGYQYNWTTDTALLRINHDDESRVSQYLNGWYQFFNPEYRKATGNYLQACEFVANSIAGMFGVDIAKLKRILDIVLSLIISAIMKSQSCTSGAQRF